MTKTDRYSTVHFLLNLRHSLYIVYFRLNLTDIPSIIFDHISTDIPPNFHRRNYAISSTDKFTAFHHIFVCLFSHCPTSSTWSLPISRLIPLQFFILHQFHFSHPSPNHPLQLINTSTTSPSFFRVIPIRAMASSNVLVQFSGSISLEPQSASQSTNIDSSWAASKHGPPEQRTCLAMWRPFRLSYTVASYQLRKVDGTLTRAVGRWLLFT
jgi:hypothetical protein